MSTVTRNTTQQRFAYLAKLSEIVFHSKDLANLWGIKNKNTLHTTLKRYAQQGLIYRIYRGFYALKPISELDPYLLGVKALHEYAYISTETVLANVGIINQVIDKITLISSKSKKFKIDNHNFYSRQLDDKFLFQTIGIEKINGVKIATPARAMADLIYFNPRAHFDNPKLIDWNKVKNIQKIIGYPITRKTL